MLVGATLRNGGAETDEEGAFFDSSDILSAESLRSASYRSRDNPAFSFLIHYDGTLWSDRDVGFQVTPIQYPYVKRRNRLPEPKEKEKPVSLWSIFKDNIGKDLSGVWLRVYFNKPLSSLHKCFEDLEYSFLMIMLYNGEACSAFFLVDRKLLLKIFMRSIIRRSQLSAA